MVMEGTGQFELKRKVKCKSLPFMMLHFDDFHCLSNEKIFTQDLQNTSSRIIMCKVELCDALCVLSFKIERHEASCLKLK